jgi:hypothetical protein
MMRFFDFEADYVQALRCIPMQVRYKLDTCGIKLKLAEWNRFNPEERQTLVERPCTSPEAVQAYVDKLQALVQHYTGQPASTLSIDPDPAWLDLTTIPASVHEKAIAVGVTLTLDQWLHLTPLERFALIKLSRPSHENSNFLPALKEFHLIKD